MEALNISVLVGRNPFCIVKGEETYLLLMSKGILALLANKMTLVNTLIGDILSCYDEAIGINKVCPFAAMWAFKTVDPLGTDSKISINTIILDGGGRNLEDLFLDLPRHTFKNHRNVLLYHLVLLVNNNESYGDTLELRPASASTDI